MKKIRKKGGSSARPKPKPVVAAVWYPNETEWRKMKQMATDPDRFENSYDAWVRMFETSIRNIESAGMFPVKVPLISSEYASWCESEGKPLEASSRSHYAALILRESAED